MDIVHPQCAGIDVHQKTVVVCAHWRKDGARQKATQTFGTHTEGLLEMLDWLQGHGITHVAMESTGVYWKPVYYILEGQIETWLVNAQHVKAVPGRKTDMNDAEWLASLMEHGLVRASYIPPQNQRELRDLTRQRANLVRDRAQSLNRLHKILQDANLKLSSVVSDIQGVSAKEMLRALAEGKADAQELASLARGSLRNKKAELEAVLRGRFRNHHRFMLAHALMQLDFLDEEIATFTQAIEEHIKAMNPPPAPPTASEAETPQGPSSALPPPTTPLTFSQAVAVWDSLPGVGVSAAHVLVAEMGNQLHLQFPTPEQLSSWAGLCPGNNESAGKRRSSSVAPGDRPVRKILVQAAWAAVRSKGSYFHALYHRIAGRRGKRRAIIAVAHAMLVCAWHMFAKHEYYSGPQQEDLSQAERERRKKHLLKRLHDLGYEALSVQASSPSA